MRNRYRTLRLSIALISALFFIACTCKTPVQQKITIKALEKTVYVGDKVDFSIVENLSKNIELRWDLIDTTWAYGDTVFCTGHTLSHTFRFPGVYHINVCEKIGNQYAKKSSIIIRAQEKGAKIVPQLVLDTDARNEIDDQHFITYALYSGVDVLAINSIHNNQPYSEAKNYGEIWHLMELMWSSDYPKETPLVFHGATHKLTRPQSGIWSDTKPIVSEASKTILAAARGASPENPVYVLPVGPCTNVASALLQAKQEGFDLISRIRVVALVGGAESAGKGTYNGKNDPWSVYVVGKSGVDFTVILEHPTSARLKFYESKDFERYPKTNIGYYLKNIMQNRFDTHDYNEKSLYDLTTVSGVINDYLNLNWYQQIEDMDIANLDEEYAWKKIGGKSNIHVVWDIDEKAMKNDFFQTINGNPTKL